MSQRNTLETLIKIKKREVDEVRLRLASHQEEYDRIDRLYKGVKINIQKEKFVPIDSPEMAKTLALFMDESYKKLDIYGEQRSAVQVFIDDIRLELAEIFGDLKRLEIALEKLIIEEKSIENKKEQKIYDELSVQRFKTKNF